MDELQQQTQASQLVKVLWVEDDQFLSGLIAKKLTSQGFDLEHASTGEQAVNLVKEKKPDVVLLDILLPEMSGFEVLAKIKADPETQNIPVILFSNLGQKEDIDKGLSLGASKFLVKSNMVPDEIAGHIREVL
jgi:DNA-binding response OmpR family regulator